MKSPFARRARSVVLAAAAIFLFPAFACALQYEVKQGDSPWTIAAKYRTTVESLCKANKLKEDAVLQPGQRLTIPQPEAAPTGSSVYRVYRVREGDTLSGIASKLGVTMCALLRANGLQEDVVLQIDQKLRLPVQVAPLAPSGPPAGYVSGSNVNARSGPGTDCGRVAVAPKGTRVLLLGKCDGWFRVRFENDREGWLSADYVKTTDADRVSTVAPPPQRPARQPDPTGFLNDEKIPVHSGPGASYARAAEGYGGTRVRLLGKCNGWFRVRFENGTTGWIVWTDLKTDGGDRVCQLAAPPLPFPASAAPPVMLQRATLTNTTTVGPPTTPGAEIPAPEQKEPTGERVRLTPAPEAAIAEEAPNPLADTAPPAEVETPQEDGPGAVPLSADARPQPTKAFAATDGVNVRKGPGTDQERVAQLRRSAVVEVLETKDGWQHVRVPGKGEGWVAAWLLTASRPPALTRVAKAAATETGDDDEAHPLVSLAMRYRGTPYRRGGTTSRGMDCSGLVDRVLHSNGISCPRTAAELYRIGTPITKDELQPGDLVFFRDTYRRGISHVGIYKGDGKFVHASSPGGAVTVTALSSPYYARKWAGARRVR